MKADAYVRDIIGSNPNMLIPHYLMACYLYYVMDHPVISDGLFDEICQRLQREWDTITHWHKPYVDREALSAGTGFHLKYPERTIGAARRMRADNTKRRKRR